MPRKGYKTITIRDEVFNGLKKQADANNRTVPKQIEYLVKKKRGIKNVRT